MLRSNLPKLLAVLVVAFAAMTGSAAASGYTGSCTTTINPSTSQNTVGSAESHMSAGQVLCLDSGTYGQTRGTTPQTYSASGSSSSPITVTAGPGQTATVDGGANVNGNYVTIENLNIDDTNEGFTDTCCSNPPPCSVPRSLAVKLNGNYTTIQDDNIYQDSATYGEVLIGVGFTSTPVGDVIQHNNLGPGGGCSQTQHLIYDDQSTGLVIFQNWFFDDHYGYAVQLYTAPSGTLLHSNVFDDVLNAIIDDSSGGGNLTYNNVEINSHGSGPFLDHYRDRTNGGPTDTVNYNAIWQVPGGIGAAESGVTLTGNQTLTTNPFQGSAPDSDSYVLGSGSMPISTYNMWDGTGPPSPNPALAFVY